MLIRTHLALGLATALYFVPYVNNKNIFFMILLAASVAPNLDSGFSSIMKNRTSSFMKRVTRHRGVLHSYTFCIIVSLLFAFFYPTIALPFFLGYSFHLFLDAFTPNGIEPYWPLKKKSTGRISTGGNIDSVMFYIFAILDVALFVKLLV